MKNSEVITAAQQLIDTPEKWTQGRFCNTAMTRFCIEGALRVALSQELHITSRWMEYNDQYRQLMHDLPRLAVEIRPEMAEWELDGLLPRHFNDNVEHEDVMVLMDKARAFYEERGE